MSPPNPPRFRPRWLTATLLLALASLSAVTPSAGEPRLRTDVDAPPPRMIWAWERPLDLRFLGGRRDVGVAFLASTIRIDRDRAFVVPRRSRLRLDPRTFRTAVVRIEAVDRAPIEDTPAVRQRIRDEIARVLALRSVRAVQLDFDARASERAVHASFVRTIDDALPRGMHFSVTTLASHCFGDPFDGASVDLPDELVPMYFRMGTDDAVVRRALRDAHHPPVASCRASAGVADDESRPSVEPTTRAYLFLTGGADERAVLASLAALPVRGAER